MLSQEQINKNKEEFINLIRSINRPGAKIDELVSKLENSDFFIAPASTKYHGSFEGGLCAHCLNVYNNLMMLCEQKHIRNEVSYESLIIVALLHDFAKMNFYKKDYRNKKVYCDNGSKRDNGGNFEWVVEESYAILPEEERFLYGNHEETSEFMVRNYIPLNYEESIAILHHHGGLSYDSCQGNVYSKIYDRYSLALMLHTADMLSAYCDKL